MIVDPVERIAYVVRMVSGALTQEMEQALRPVKLTQIQLAALVQLSLSTGHGLSTAELAKRCGVTAQSMSSALAGLCRRGLITRAPPPTHGRVVEIRVTDDGRTLAQQAQRLTAGVNARALVLVNTHDRRLLHELPLQVATGLGLPVAHESTAATTQQSERDGDV
jgi:DNA-binding MarR family transcriptional regulator